MEIERKFLIQQLPVNISDYEYHTLEQGYLCTDPVIRIRRDNDTYFLTYKSKGFLVREEHNLPLTKESYQHMLSKIDGLYIRKKRYYIPYSSYTIELDLFEESLSPLILAEVEFTSVEEANAFLPPNWFGEDVTRKPDYQNSHLAQYGLSRSI